MMIAPRIQPATAPEMSTLGSSHPAMARTVLTAIHGQAIVGCADDANGAMLTAASTPAATNGTLTLSLRPSGSDSANAAATIASSNASILGWPSKSIAIANAAAPPMIRNASMPPQLFCRFHGSGAIGVARPTSVAEPSPKAISTHATAAISMCQLKTTMSAQTAAG